MAKVSHGNASLVISSTAPGFQLYTGNWLNGTSTLPNGTPIEKFSSLCIEPSFPPDAINHDEWKENVVIRPGQTWKQTIVYSVELSE